MDINAVRALLRMNSIAEGADETVIRSALTQASYSLEEIDTALALLRGGAGPSVQTSSIPLASGSSTPSFNGKKSSRRFGFIPQRWLSLHGFLFLLIGYFVVMPVGGLMLVWGLFALTPIPVIGLVAFMGALALLFVGHFTGTNMIADAYLHAGYQMAAEVMNAQSAPYSIIEIPCEEGFAFTIDGEQSIRVERSYFGGATVGYSLLKENKGTLTITTPSATTQVLLAEYGKEASVVTRSDLPFMAPEDLYILKNFDESTNSMGLANMLNEVSGFGTGESGEGANIISVDASRVSLDEFKTLTACIAKDEDENGILHNRTSFLRDFFGIGRVASGRVPAWGYTDTAFICSDDLKVQLTFPSYVSVRFEQYGVPYISRIGVVNSDLSTRGLTEIEIRRLSPELWWDDYLRYQECVEADKCSTGQSGYDPETGAPRIVGYVPFSSLSPGNQRSYISTLGSKRKSFGAAGIAEGIPATFDSCKNSEGQTIKEYLSR